MIENKSAFNRFAHAFQLKLMADHNGAIKISKAREILAKAVGAKSHNQLLSQLPMPLENWQDPDALSRLSSLLRSNHDIKLQTPCAQLMQSVIEEFEAMPEDLAKLSAKADQTTYAITSSYTGYPDVSIAKGIGPALRTFLKTATMTADLFPEDKVSFIGQDIDDGMPILAMLLGDDVMVTLQRPAISDGLTVNNGQLVNLSNNTLPGIDSAMPPQDIAYRLTQVYNAMNRKEREQRVQRVIHSLAALRLSRDFGEVLIECGKDSECRVADKAFDTHSLLTALDNIKLMYSTTATIRG